MSTSDDFRDGLAQLAAYVAKNGHGRVPYNHATAEGFKLGRWVARRRAVRKMGRLSPEREAELTAAGMVWDPKGDDDRAGLAHLRAYIDEHGHGRVPLHHVTVDGFKLGQWVRNRQTD